MDIVEYNKNLNAFIVNGTERISYKELCKYFSKYIAIDIDINPNEAESLIKDMLEIIDDIWKSGADINEVYNEIMDTKNMNEDCGLTRIVYHNCFGLIFTVINIKNIYHSDKPIIGEANNILKLTDLYKIKNNRNIDMKNESNEKNCKDIIVKCDSNNNFLVYECEKSKNNYEDKHITFEEKYSKIKTKRINYNELKNYKKYINVLIKMDEVTPKEYKLLDTILYEIFGKTISHEWEKENNGKTKILISYTIDDTLSWSYLNKGETVDYINYEYLYIAHMFTSSTCGSMNTNISKKDIPTIEEIQKGTIVPSDDKLMKVDTEDSKKDIPTIKKIQLGTIITSDYKLMKVDTEDIKEKGNPNQGDFTSLVSQAKILPTKSNSAPVLYFDGTTLQNIALFCDFYKITEGNYIPTKGNYFIYDIVNETYTITTDYNDENNILSTSKYIQSFKQKHSVEHYANILLKIIFKELNKKGYNNLLFNHPIIVDFHIYDDTFNEYSEFVKDTSIMDAAEKRVNELLGKTLDWNFTNNVLTVTLNINDFIY